MREVAAMARAGRLEELVDYVYSRHPRVLFSEDSQFAFKCLNFIRDLESGEGDDANMLEQLRYLVRFDQQRLHLHVKQLIFLAKNKTVENAGRLRELFTAMITRQLLPADGTEDGALLGAHAVYTE